MKILLFGATGMVGQGVLRECLLAPDVEQVLAVGRSATGQAHPKLRELVHPNLFDYSAVEKELTGYDACFFCLGITSIGMTEEAYSRITYDLTLAAAQAIAKLNPQSIFIYVSGTGTDSTEKGSRMWARVKGRTENALFRLPLRACMFRPGMIQALHGIQSKTAAYRVIYPLLAPLFSLVRMISPDSITTTELVGRAMLQVARQGAPQRYFEMADINGARPGLA
jgi:uncharacterized protein YbjT (DUF2867 family)